MRLKQLQQFVTLAQTTNFHRAAELLHITQPALSISIRNLERDLGAALFDRTSVGTVLTDAGQAMLIQAQHTLFHAEQCQQMVINVQQGLGGLLRVGFIGSATYALLPKLVPSLRARFPKLELELIEATSSEVLQGVTSRQLDIGFLRYPVLDPLACDVTPLDRDAFVLAVPEGCRLAEQGDSIALSLAADQPFIMYHRAKVPNLSAMAMMRCQASGFLPHIAQEALQVQTIMSLVASGLGVALIAGIARNHVQPGVKCLTLSDTPSGQSIGIGLAFLRSQRSLLVDKVVNHINGEHAIEGRI